MEYHFILSLCFCVIFLFFFSCRGCLEQERIGLLQLKVSIAMKDTLLSWVDGETSDCCTWERISCNPTTGRVTELYLNQAYGNTEEDSYLNASLFLPFQQLRTLDLSENLLSRWQNNQGFERLSELKYLEDLNLEKNLFNNIILPSLGELTSLKTLKLGGNGLDGSLSEYSQVFKNLSNLIVLDLSLNQLDGFFPFDDLTNTSKLKILDLSFNHMSGRIPPSILSLNSLESLSLALNDITDLVSGFCELKSLQELDISSNKFEGTLPACLRNLTSLRVLDVSNNELTGNLQPSLISSLTSLEYISISDNHFEAGTMFTSLMDHNSQFKFLGFSKCNLNLSTNDLLKILLHQYNLTGIDLSHNNLYGDFPNWLLANNTRLKSLVLRNNSLSGHMQFPLLQLVNLEWIDVSANFIHGQLQTDIGQTLPRLVCLNTSKNSLEGRIPTSLANMEDLLYLDLVLNNFVGEIPDSLALGCRGLRVLLLCRNKLYGHIPPNIFNLTSLDTLHLRENQFTGYIPKNNIGSFSLRTVDISSNLISGELPTWIGNLTRLTTFAIQNNSFVGSIPLEFCNLAYLEFLDLSQNQISGYMPSCLMSLPSLSYLHLHQNQLIGSIPKTFPEKSNLLALDLRDNNLLGDIPSSFGSLSNLRLLLLKDNHLSGLIPVELCRLSNITILDLSNNMLSGPIPRCFSNITFGKIGAVDPLTFSEAGSQSMKTTRFDYMYTNRFGSGGLAALGYTVYIDRVEIEFMTKRRYVSYAGDILNFMSGMDLSCNNFTGGIPLEIGALTDIRALNFSHNQLSGTIPKALSNLNQIESMDLSYNKLSGEIPSDLTGIYTLSVFSVAYNNLSGQIPDMKAQFSTFDKTTYEGNPFLCGTPLQTKCSPVTPSVADTIHGLSEKFGIDPTSFLASFSVSYVVCFLGFVIIFVKHV